MLRFAGTPVVVMKRELATCRCSAVPRALWRHRGRPRGWRHGAARDDGRGRKAVAGGRPVIIFPEGTRVPLGTRPPLRPGFAGLYRALGLPVVPIALDSGALAAGFSSNPARDIHGWRDHPHRIEARRH